LTDFGHIWVKIRTLADFICIMIQPQGRTVRYEFIKQQKICGRVGMWRSMDISVREG
jgi:hypothetical protein